MDSSTAKGLFTQDIQAFIGTDCFPKFASIGVKYFITVTPQSAITKMGVKSFSEKTGPHGLKLVEVSSVSEAIDWLNKNK